MKLRRFLEGVEPLLDEDYDITLFSNKYKLIYKDNSMFLNEMLNKSVNYEMLVRILLKTDLIDNVIDNDVEEYGIEIRTTNKINVSNFNKIYNQIDSLGWFISVASLFDNRSNELYDIEIKNIRQFVSDIIDIENYNYILTLEPKFDKLIKSDDIDELYHISFDMFHKNIMKQGLIPKNKNKLSYHPSRIYFLMNADDNQIKSLAEELLKKYTRKDDVKKIYVYKISSNACKSYKFFSDINLRNGGVYTESLIPSKYIEIYGSADIIIDKGKKIIWDF